MVAAGRALGAADCPVTADFDQRKVVGKRCFGTLTTAVGPEAERQTKCGENNEGQVT